MLPPATKIICVMEGTWCRAHKQWLCPGFPRHGVMSREDLEEVMTALKPSGEGLTFAQLHATNIQRCKRWHPNFMSGDGDEWTGADWSNAMCGESGEAANIVKKLRRLETGTTPGPDDPPKERLLEMLDEEIADVICYADLLAAHYGLDPARAVAMKFNKVSEKQGFPERLPLP